MRFLRRKLVIRAFSLTALLVFVNSVFYPTVSYALTSGVHQPEYTSYEDAQATDMVNLLTGDFTFNMPVLSVPVGSEGDFTVPLSYHAGIGPDQEASWVGLGWNLNVGSLTRSINGFPDDANGEAQVVNVKDLTGRRGWSASVLGSNLGWDSETGHYGVVSLLGFGQLSYANGGVTSVGIAGLSVSGSGIGFSAEQFAMAALSFAMTSAMSGLNGTLQTALGVSALALDVALPSATPSLGAQGYWRYSKRTKRGLFHTDYWIWLNQTRTEDMYGILHLDKANQNTDAGSNYADHDYFLKVRNNINNTSQPVKRFIKSSSISNKGAASDINIDLSVDESYKDNNSPALLAYDNFQVNGPGISGAIKPYRMEVGSVSVPREMTSRHIRLNPVQYIDYGSSKVPFVYEGSNGNRYFHHMGGAAAVTSPAFNFGIGSTKVNVGAPSGQNPYAIRHDLNDVIFTNERVRSDVSATKRLPQGNYVDWLTNGEIKNTTGRFSNSAFLDYFEGGANSPRESFRATYKFGAKTLYFSGSVNAGVISFAGTEASNIVVNDLVDVYLTEYVNDGYGNMEPVTTAHLGLQVTAKTSTSITVNSPINLSSLDGFAQIYSYGVKSGGMIGGFVVTGADGMNYHYAIPVYDYAFKAYNEKKTDANKNSTITRSGQFANTWLLTAITGPDFVDRGGANNAGNGIIDDNDWGYWVKFNYGLHTAAYNWRAPYSGFTSDSEDAYKTYASGKKEKYYLNSIETRSHVALFIKDARKDAKDATESGTKITSLRLNEIALLTRESYETLTDPAGSYQLKKASGTIDVTYHTGNNDNNADAGDNVVSSKLTYVQQNAIRRIQFNYDETYPLCMGAVNSDAGYGKLTLKSVSIRGKNNAKLFPDYKFSYAHNPSYDANKWDGWGMYNSQGTSAGTTHQASPVDSDGWAWSLTSIKSPEGKEIVVEYERDDYASVSGVITMPHYAQPAADQNVTDGVTTIANPQYFVNGERVTVSQNEEYTCMEQDFCEEGSGTLCYFPVEYSIPHTVQGTVQGNTVIMDSPIVITPADHCPGDGTMSAAGTVWIEKNSDSKKGGNIRVKALTLKDDVSQIQYKTRYIYSQNSEPWSTSSGVVSLEPDYIKVVNHSIYSRLGYPMTPVMYSKVTILSGRLTNDSDFYTKQVYEFETPNAALYNVGTTVVKNKSLVNSFTYSLVQYKDYETQVKHEIEDRTGRIGKLKSIRTFDNAGALKQEQVMVYSEALLNDGVNNYQGMFTEGTLLNEIITNDYDRYHKFSRTTQLKYPYVLQKTVSTVDGQTSSTESMSWDLYTGGVNTSVSTSPLGLRIKSVSEPAYLKYPELGSKALNPSNKNMMLQQAASYTYRLDNFGNETGLLSASATTWSKEWANYRKQDANGNYVYSNDLDANGNGTIDATEAAMKVWRKSDSYVWKGTYSRKNADGSHAFSTSDKFNFTTPSSNPLWQRLGAQEMYSHNSILLQSSDLNGIYASSKVGYQDKLVIASAVNAKHGEIAYSGAEDRLSATSAYFGGEVSLGNGSVVTSPTHTGSKALSLSSGDGFVFKSSDVLSNKKYRASVWSNSTNARVYYKVNGGSEVVPAPIISQAVTLNGNAWYRVDIDFVTPATSITSFEIGVKSASGSIVVDDFRFQPFESGMTCYVYEPGTSRLLYSLDNDNVYVRLEYNDRGQVVKTYQEFIRYQGEKLMTESRDNYRRFHLDQ